jgi:hypothetical protein
MRGIDHQQGDMFSYLSPEQRVRKDHPLRAVRAMTDGILERMSPLFDAMYAASGRPSIPPEKLLRGKRDVLAVLTISGFCEDRTVCVHDGSSGHLNAPTDAAGPIPPPWNTEQAIKVGVRPLLLAEWLGERWVGRCIQVDSNDLKMAEVQQIVDSLLPDVPVERRKKAPETGFQLLVVDRDAFALELAHEWVRSGLPRTTVR